MRRILSLLLALLALPALAQVQTPAPTLTYTLATGGVATTIINGYIRGAWLCNPLSAADQGIGAAEVVYVTVSNPAAPIVATMTGNGPTSNLAAGQCLTLPNMTVTVSALAATSGHKLNVVQW